MQHDASILQPATSIAAPLGAAHKGSPMNRPMRLAISLAVLSAASLGASSAHALSWVSLINCTGKKVYICAFDNGDLVKKFESASGSLAPCTGPSNCSDSSRASYGCGSNNGCQINVTGGGACVKADNLISRSLHQHPWKIIKKGNSGYDYVQVSPDWKYFDDAANRGCK